jgi:threonine dehydrogenase-like Zn-dependent dehydrogenase
VGHEWVGEIVEVGKRVEGVEPGTRVVGDGYCGYAEYASGRSFAWTMAAR